MDTQILKNRMDTHILAVPESTLPSRFSASANMGLRRKDKNMCAIQQLNLKL